MREPYAGIEDVRSHLSFVPTFTATGRPNATQVSQFLADAANDLDVALQLADYSLPIATSATMAQDTLRTWNAIGAAYYTALAMPQGSDSKHAKDLGDRWTVLLKAVQEGDTVLPLDLDTSRALPRHGGTPSSRFSTDPTVR